MDLFPRTQVENISLPRMLIGSNWMLGYSHRTTSADSMIRERYSTREAVSEVICAYLAYGIDAMMAPFVGDDLQPNAVVMDGIHMAEDKMGRKLILIDTPIVDVSDTPQAHDFTARKIETVRKNGADICLLHHSSVEQLVCKHTGTIDRLPEYTRMIRENGMIPGLSAHMPELVLYSDNHPEYRSILLELQAEEPGLFTPENVRMMKELLREGVNQEIAWGKYVIGEDIVGLTGKMVEDYILYLGNLRWSSLGFGTLYEGHEEEPADMAWVSQYANANMVKTDFFEAKSTAYAKSAALEDDL